MDPFLRVLKYVWPYRRKVVLSMFFALLVAFFWSLNLSMTFLVVKVFLQGQNVEQYVNGEIAVVRTEVENLQGSIKRLRDQIEPSQKAHDTGHDNDTDNNDTDNNDTENDNTDNDGTDDNTVDVLKHLSRQQAKLSSASTRLLVFNRIKTYVVPYLPSDQFDTYALILGVFLLATLLKGLSIFVQEVLIGNVVELTAMDIRKQCFRKTLSLDYQTLSLNGKSDLMSRFTYDIQLLTMSLRLVGGKLIREPLKAAGCILVALFYSWQLTLLSMLFAPLAAIFFYRIGRKLKQASRRLMESMSRIYKTLEETLSSMKVVIAFNGGRKHRAQFHRENKRYFSKAMKIVRIDALTSPTTEMMGLFAACLALLPGAYLVLRGTRSIWGITLVSESMEIAHLSAFYVALAGIIDPARKLSTTFVKLKRGMAAAERVFNLIDKQSLVKEATTPKPMPRHTKSIEFYKINFTYAGHVDDGAARPPVLEDVSLTVKAGEVIVVVGENGSGKSTLVNLLPRYYDPDSGSVLFDGVDIRDVRLRDLRSQIGVVTQDTLLFDETIYENIRYGKPNATKSEIEEAARRAHVTQFVDQLPEGFQTPTGELGGRLSGGQRQRIALARAMLRDPAVLILDEATSAVDSQSERLIHQALRDFTQGRTTFLITHSVSQSILDFVTRVVIMDQGRLIAAGSHDDVLSTCPVYQRLYHAHVGRHTEYHDRDSESQPASRAVEHDDGPPETDADKENSSGGDSSGAPHILPLRIAQTEQVETLHRPSEKAAETTTPSAESRSPASTTTSSSNAPNDSNASDDSRTDVEGSGQAESNGTAG